MNALTDVIAAISTPPGTGGVAVIRMSGDGALDIADRVFMPVSGKKLSEHPPRTQVYGYVIREGERIDDALAAIFPAPRSYTGEDTAEICCHGGIAVTRAVLEALLTAGARPAEAGEFTRRAFINGAMSLTEAEAISDLLSAQSIEQIKLSARPARTLLSEKIKEIRAALTGLMSSIYARIDYPDEDLGDFDDSEVTARLKAIYTEIDKLASTYRTGRAISEGIATAILGKPNVGKSSLYNLLCGEDAAIVTDIPGTTRDVLSRTVSLGRVTLRLADTAGIRECESIDPVERIGIEKSRQILQKSELLFTLFDISTPFDSEDEEIIKAINSSSAAKIAVLNKSDKVTDGEAQSYLEALPKIFDKVLTISAESSPAEATEALTIATEELFTDERIRTGHDPIISSARQHASISRALEFVGYALESIRAGFSQDAASSDIERALGAISELDGRAVNEEIVADIFSKFCVGK